MVAVKNTFDFMLAILLSRIELFERNIYMSNGIVRIYVCIRNVMRVYLSCFILRTQKRNLFLVDFNFILTRVNKM